MMAPGIILGVPPEGKESLERFGGRGGKSGMRGI